ncbi:translation initiation factor IF-2-like isoform X3 [Fukomys damarensis]|uniref:translation initiation factor IF-2-like isoform X3 n=1 Tax=Fukomys damarensis TaxID=885580 RepID=UPI00054009EC|nr:translation initiation factor IF-2-like isoform X3 [Fukomys damarensis]
MQNMEPPKDAGEGEEKGIPSLFPASSSFLSTRRRRAAQIPLLSLLKSPYLRLPRSADWPKSSRKASPPRPSWFFPAVEVGRASGSPGVSAPAELSRAVPATPGRLELALGAEVARRTERRQRKRRGGATRGGDWRAAGGGARRPATAVRTFRREGRGSQPGGGRLPSRSSAEFRPRCPCSAPTRGKFTPGASGWPAPSGSSP